MVTYPSTRISVPVVYVAASLARYKYAPFSSFANPSRLYPSAPVKKGGGWGG